MNSDSRLSVLKPTLQVPKTNTLAVPNTMDDISEERKQEMIAHAQMLRNRFPHMKETRIMKKTAEYFKIKLVDNEGNSNLNSAINSKRNIGK